jgi:hypothetical protein
MGFSMKKLKNIILILLLVIMFLFPITPALGTMNTQGRLPTPPLPGYCNNEQMLFSEESIQMYETKNIEYIPSIQTLDNNIISIIQNLRTSMTIGYIENLTSFGPRLTGSDACFDAAAYIYEEFEAMGLDVRYQNWSVSDNLYGSNVEATIQGINNPNDEIYIVCGHYDSVSSSPGADDNAAGTSVVLSTAEIMSQYRFNHTIKFVTFSGEEQGLYGSKAYATEASENNDNIIAVLNADMMGYAETQEGERKVVVYDNDASSWITNYTSQISNEYHEFINLEIVRGGTSGRSDHASFHRQGFNAIFYFEYEMNPNYHSPQDILENMNPGYATNVSRLALATLMSLGEFTTAHMPEKPSRPIGENSGSAKEEYTYVTTSHDPDNDDLWYKWDWGDNTFSEWIGPYKSGESCEMNHTWNKRGYYEVRVKARDANGLESKWSDSLVVTMPKNKFITNLFLKFLQNNPWMNTLLKRFLD